MRLATGAVLILSLTALSLPGCGIAVRKSAAVGFRVGDARTEAGDVRPASSEEPVEEAAEAPVQNPQTEPANAGRDGHSHPHGPHAVSVLFNTMDAHWQTFKTWFIRSYRKNKRWPEPYASLSEGAFHEHWDVQARAGQKYVLGLFDFHFQAGSGNLNAAGRRRLMDILRSMPPGTRTIYVQAARSKTETEERVAAVRKAIENSPLLDSSLQVAVMRGMPAAISGAEASKAAANLVESVGDFPRWMDRNTRIDGEKQGEGN